MEISPEFERKLEAGAMALGMLCALYRTRNIPTASESTARVILQHAGELARLDDERAALEARMAAI